MMQKLWFRISLLTVLVGVSSVVSASYFPETKKWTDTDTLDGHDSTYFQREISSANCATGIASIANDGTLSCASSQADTDWTEGGGNVYRASGNVGIGTTSPGAKLEIRGSESHVSGDLAGADGLLRLYNTYSSDVAEKGATIVFEDNYLGTNRTTRAAIKGGTQTAGNTADGFLSFYTDSGGANSMQEHMRIDKSGNVGIGTTSPNEKLNVSGNIKLDGTSVGGAQNSIIWRQSNMTDPKYNFAGITAEWTSSGGQQSGKLKFQTSNLSPLQDRMVIDEDGNVGIGTTSPNGKLDVMTGIGKGIYFTDTTGDGSGSPQISSTGGDLFLDSTSNIQVRDHLIPDTDSTKRLGASNRYWSEGYIDDVFVSQSMSIGTTTPSGSLKLDVEGPVGATQFCDANGANCKTITELSNSGTDDQTATEVSTTDEFTNSDSSNVQDVLDDLDSAIDTHKYHKFVNDGYYFDTYNQDNYLRLFTETASYDTVRFQPYSNVEYWNGSAWTAWMGGDAVIESLLDGRQETGSSIDHTHRKFRFEVTRNSGWPTMALIVMQSSWTGLQYPGMQVTVETYDGSTWNSKEVCDFDAAHTGNTYGFHIKATTALHDGKVPARVTVDITDWTDSGSYTTIPLRNFMILSNFSGAGDSMEPFTWDYAGELKLKTVQNSGSDTDKFLVSDGGEIRYRTGAQVLSDIGAQSAASGIDGSGTANYVPKFTDANTIGNSQIFDNGTSVGIGTASPSSSYKLDVNGTMRVQGGSGVSYITSSADNPLTVQGTNTWSGIKFQDSVNSDYIWYGGTGNTFAIGGGGSNHSGKLHVDGGTTIGSTLDNTNPPTDGLLVSGNVGIGTTNPTEKLFVSGNMKLSGGIGVNAVTSGSGTVNVPVTPGGYLSGGTEILSRDTTNNYTKLRGTTGEGIQMYVDSSTMAVAIDTSGSVGIGDTTPDGSLKLDVEGPVGATQFCDANGANCFSPANVGTGDGDVAGPTSSTDNAIARFDGTTGKLVQNSAVTIDDSNNLSTAGYLAGSSARVTNIVTNKIVKFDGLDLDDSIISDDGSTATVGGALTATGNITAPAYYDPSGSTYYMDLYGTSYFNAANAENFYVRDDGIDEGISWNSGAQSISVPSVAQGGYQAFRFESDAARPFYFEGSNFGIGTASPDTALHVASGGTTDIKIEDTAGSIGGWRLRAGNANANDFAVLSGTSNTRLTIDSSGNVGIGTTSPSKKLHVVGDAMVTGELNGWSTLETSNPGNTTQWVKVATLDAATDAEATVRIIGGRDYGRAVNTDHWLTVSKRTDTIGVDYWATGDYADATDEVDIYVYRDTATTPDTAYIYVKKNPYTHPLIQVYAKHSTTVDLVDDATAPTTSVYWHNKTDGPTTSHANGGMHIPRLDVNGEVLIKSGEYLSWGSSGVTSIEGSTVSNKLDFKTNSTSRMYIADGGNVGIGTSSPGAKLDVAGNIRINRPSNKVDNSGLSEIQGFEINNAFGSGASGYVKVYYPTQDNLIFGADYDGNIGGTIPNIEFGKQSTPYLHIQNSGSTTGNVGIGTSSPQTKLDVDGTITVRGSDSTGVETPMIKFMTGTTDDLGSIRTYNDGGYNQDMRFYTSNVLSGENHVMTLRANGNVGIGTASPGEKLEVAGNVKATGGYYLGANTTAKVRLDGTVGSRMEYGAQYFTVDSADAHIHTASTERLTVKNSGSVGIGDTSPDGSLKLDVEGPVGATQFCDANGANCFSPANVGTGDGDVAGPASSTDNAITRFDGTTGKLVQNSGVTIDDSNNLTAAGDLTANSGVIKVGTSNNYITTSGAPGGYLALQSTGNELLIGGSSSSMVVNYRAAPGGTPTNFIWRAGSSSSWANHQMGALTLAGTFDPNGAVTLPTTGISGAGAGSGLDADKLDGIDSSRIVYGTNQYATQDGRVDLDGVSKSGFYFAGSGHSNGPASNGAFIHLGYDNSSAYGGQIFVEHTADQLWFRKKNSGTWGSWQKVWHSGNDGSNSGLDADTLDGHDTSYFQVAGSYLTSETDPTVPAYTKTLTSATVVRDQVKTVDGSGSGLDADNVDGKSAEYLRKNLAASSVWTTGTGTASADFGSGFSSNGSASENSRGYAETPYTSPGLTWKSVNDAASDGDGGWDKDILGVSDSKTYRSVVWVRRTSSTSSGNFYHGCHSSATLNLSGTDNTNPYFSSFAISELQQNRWYLSVGYIHANSDTSTISYGGLYDAVTGKKVRNYSDFKMKSGATTQRHRTYLYYSTDPTSNLEWWGPRFEEVDGDELSVATLLGHLPEPRLDAVEVAGDGTSHAVTFGADDPDATGKIYWDATLNELVISVN